MIDFIRRLERLFKLAGRYGISAETRNTLLYGQLQEGLKHKIMESPAVSGATGYQKLFGRRSVWPRPRSSDSTSRNRNPNKRVQPGQRIRNTDSLLVIRARVDFDAGILSFAVGTVSVQATSLLIARTLSGGNQSSLPEEGELSRYTVLRTVLEDKSHSRLPRLPQQH